MTMPFTRHPARLRRSVLCVPADNPRALAKVRSLSCDAVIYDLEDSVSIEAKAEGRKALIATLADQNARGSVETIIRINGASSGFAEDDLACILACNPDAVLLPKVESPQTIQSVADFLFDNDAAESLRIWAMIETPRGVLNAAAIAETGRTRGGRLDCFVPGLNDLRKETGVAALPGRTYLTPWLMQIVLAARGNGLDIIDSVFNDFRDETGFTDECRQGRDMGFDGKMLIHPAQIGPANRMFGISEGTETEARDIIEAFERPENSARNVINLKGSMVERLHLDQAIRLVTKADAIRRKDIQS